MELLALCLKAVGITADVATLAQTISTLLEHEDTYSASDLFARCFRHAVEKRRVVLGRLSNPKGAEHIRVAEVALHDALKGIHADALSLQNVDPQDVARILAPHFRAAVVIPNHQLDETKLDAQVQQLVTAAIQQFISELPLHAQSFREVVIAHLNAMQLGQSELNAKVEELCNRVAEISDELSDEPSTDPTTLQFESARPELRNPFRIVTAENFDHNHQLLARLFRAPSDYDSIRSHDNLLIAGGRGCGKSMILKSLSVNAAVEIERLSRHPSEPDTAALTFAESGLDYFGVYIKLFRGFFSQYTADSRFDEESAHVYFQHYFNMLLLRALVQTLQEASITDSGPPTLHLSRSEEESVVTEVAAIGDLSVGDDSLRSLIKALRQQEHCVMQYMTRVRLGHSAATYEGHFTSIDHFLDECCRAICKSISDLNGCRVYFLLDEFENLTRFQQKVVNTLAKLRPTSLTLKIATRAGGLRAMDNLQGDAMQFPRDYHYVSLDYDISSKAYKELLIEIANRRLKAEGFEVPEITMLLPDAPPCCPSTRDEIDAAIRAFLSERGDDPSSFEAAKWSEKCHQWREAFVFRLNEKRQKPRWYAGVDDFVRLSSGIVSNFLELCKMAFYMATWEGIDVRNGEEIPVRTQNEAVYKTSEAAFDWISKNIADTGPMVSRLIGDLAAIVRHKLLNHTSEPEASRIALKDPASLEDDAFELVCTILDDAVRWSVLHTPQATRAYLPKHREDVRPSDYLFNRLLHPALRISLNARWATRFSATDLLRLCDAGSRNRKRRELLNKHGGASVKASRSSHQSEIPYPESGAEGESDSNA